MADLARVESVSLQLALMIFLATIHHLNSAITKKKDEGKNVTLLRQSRMPGGWGGGGGGYPGGPYAINCYYCNIFVGGGSGGGGGGGVSGGGGGGWGGGGSSWEAGDALNDAALARHNEYRRKHGASPLVLNSSLIQAAKAYARKSFNYKPFMHSCQDRYGCGYGENQYGGSGSGQGVPDEGELGNRATKKWYDEISRVNWNDIEGSQGTIGHFTQVVWRSTTQIGCGVHSTSTGNGYRFNLICQYAPAGNTQGQYKQNVRRPNQLDRGDGGSHNDSIIIHQDSFLYP